MLRRPQRVASLLESLRATAPAAKVLFVTDPDDDAERAAIAVAGEEFMDHAGTYPQKINAAFRATWEPFVFLAADDLRFHDGWAEAALARMSARVGVVGTNDLGNRRVLAGKHSTHSLVSRDYAMHRGTLDQRDAVLHEGYRHNFCDDELVGTARKRHAFAFAPDAIVEHLHPNWRPEVGRDDVYDLGQASFEEDRRLWRQRRRRWNVG